MRDHFGNQHRFYRRDPTGRFTKLEEKETFSLWGSVIGGVVMGFVLALLFFWGI